MSSTNESTTLVCLFHHRDQAQAAVKDLQGAGIPQASISTIGDRDAQGAGSSTLESFGVPARDLSHLRAGIEDGGVVVAVSAISGHVKAVENIFDKHQATKIDETVSRDGSDRVEPGDGERVIPIVQEELEVGKRTVDQGGVRVYRRVIEIPAEESINLREEHVVVERNAVDRPASQADLDAQGSRSIELTETAEEAVVSKDARVIEEVIVGKETGEHTEHIRDTLRRTEVEVEQLAPKDVRSSRKNSV